MDKAPKYPIKTVSNLTGLSTYLIRAWEKRYGVIKPERTETNRRIYSDEDIAKLRLLTQATSMGFSIGSISGFSTEKLKNLTRAQVSTKLEEEKQREYDLKDQLEISPLYLQDSIASIINFNPDKLRDILLKASIDLRQKELLSSFVVPLISHIGENWQNGSLSISQEHMASSVIVNFLQYLKDIYKNAANSPTLISATPQGEHHELGALMVSSIAASEGWNVIHLGTNLPADELFKASEETSAKVICLSLVYPAHDQLTGHYLKRLNDLAGSKRKIIIGGKSARSYTGIIKDTEILLIEDINEFRLKLNNFK